MREVKAPSPPGLQRRVLLAGSIETGKAGQWQERIVAALSAAGAEAGVLPRRVLAAGNVEMVCRRHRIPLFETLDDLIADLT